jgi:uncharacterized Zn finger protein
MSRYFGSYGSWAPYVSVAERRMQAEREIARLRKEGQAIAPVIIEGRAIATTFWGKAWCDNLESYHDFAYRLPRGRSYVRNRAVLDLQIAPREVKALVSGASIYEVRIGIAQTPAAQWRAIRQDCAGGIDSLVELLRGRFSKSVMERLCRQDKGLFPRPSEIKFSCSCPDFADMCKHVAAALYGVGARLDQEPKLLFRLRAVDEADLLTHLDGAAPMSMTGPAASRVLEDGDISALFGLEMADDTSIAPTSPPRDKTQARPKPAHLRTSRSGHTAANKSPVRKRKPPASLNGATTPSANKAASLAKPSGKRREAPKPGRVLASASAPATPRPTRPGPKKLPSGGKQ